MGLFDVNIIIYLSNIKWYIVLIEKNHPNGRYKKQMFDR